jgi:hypothetical protein
LLASGRLVLEQSFPGFSQELIEAGAVTGDVVTNSRWFNEGGCLKRFKSGVQGPNLLAPPSSILNPKVAWRVFAGNVRTAR